MLKCSIPRRAYRFRKFYYLTPAPPRSHCCINNRELTNICPLSPDMACSIQLSPVPERRTGEAVSDSNSNQELAPLSSLRNQSRQKNRKRMLLPFHSD